MRLVPMSLLLLGLCACADSAPPAAEPTDATPPAATPGPQPANPPAPARETPPAAQQDVPARFRGRYAGDATACTQPGHETALTLQARRIEFHESAGDVVAARADGDEIAIDASLSGEGDTWQRTYRFRLESDDTALRDAEGGLRRVRCEAG